MTSTTIKVVFLEASFPLWMVTSDTIKQLIASSRLALQDYLEYKTGEYKTGASASVEKVHIHTLYGRNGLLDQTRTIQELKMENEETVYAVYSIGDEKKSSLPNVLQISMSAPVLQISMSASKDDTVISAIKIVNRVLQTPNFNVLFQTHFSSAAASRRIQEVSIEFGEHQKLQSGRHALAWVNRDTNTKTLYLHKHFLTRLEDLRYSINYPSMYSANEIQTKKREIETITFYFAYLLLHELGHLLLRWQGNLHTPPLKFVIHSSSPEAGAFLNYKLFGCDLRALIPASPGGFGEDIELNGMCMENKNFEKDAKSRAKKIAQGYKDEPEFIRVHHDYIRDVVSGRISLSEILNVLIDLDNYICPLTHTAMSHTYGYCSSDDDDIEYINEQEPTKTEPIEPPEPRGEYVAIDKPCLFQLEPNL